MTRWTVALSAVLAIILSIGVFRITYQVDEMEKELLKLNSEILDEQETIHILNAEWSHLNDPGRLERLARQFLGLENDEAEVGLKTMNAGQLINLKDLDPDRVVEPEKDKDVRDADWKVKP